MSEYSPASEVLTIIKESSYSWLLYDDEVGEIYASRGGYKSGAYAFTGAKAFIKKELDLGKLESDTDKALEILRGDEVVESYEGTAVEHYLTSRKGLLDKKEM